MVGDFELISDRIFSNSPIWSWYELLSDELESVDKELLEDVLELVLVSFFSNFLQYTSLCLFF